MTEKPILFSSPMVRAILNDTKTQTRRIMKPQPPEYWCPNVGIYAPSLVCRRTECVFPGPEVFGASDENFDIKSPYGKPGDFLWVKETFRVHGGEEYVYQKNPSSVIYKASAELQHPCYGIGECWKPSIYMPRWASRITLRIKNIRVERLQDISEKDAWAEGCSKGDPADNGGFFPADEFVPQKGKRWEYVAMWDSPIDWYADLWDGLNAKRGFGWDTNPWVWVVEFKREGKNND